MNECEYQIKFKLEGNQNIQIRGLNKKKTLSGGKKKNKNQIEKK